VAGDEAEWRQGRAEADAAAANGVGVQEVDAPTLKKLESALAPLRGGWLLDDGRRLDPAALTVSSAMAARSHGADIRHHLAARALVEDGDRVVGVVTDEGRIGADTTVLAAGPWSNALLRPIGHHLPVVAARGWLVQLHADPSLVRRIVERAGWHLLPGEEGESPLLASDAAQTGDEPEVGTLLHPSPDGLFTVGGSRQLPAVEAPEDHDVPRRIVARAIDLVPALADAPVVSAWWGLRPMTPDGRPLVGELRPGLLAATGHGSQGVILGGGTGALVACLVTGEEPPFDPAPFDPRRFRA
jgi:glycine/D-amino acid oxidase-like deaminating enzyme